MPFHKKVDTLQTLCIKTISKNMDTLQDYLVEIPFILVDEVYSFAIRNHNEKKNGKLIVSTENLIHSGLKKFDNYDEYDHKFQFDLSHQSIIDRISVCNNLTHLNIAWWKDISPCSLSILVQNLPKIQKLNLSSSSCTNYVLGQIGKHCSQLVHLNISLCPVITDDGIQDLCMENKKTSRNMNIQYLNLKYNESITSKGCLCALKNLPYLKQLKHQSDLFYTKFDGTYGIESIYFEDVWPTDSFWTTDSLKNAVVMFPNLRNIKIKIEFIDIPTLKNININQNLTTLKLHIVYDLDVSVIGYLFPVLKTLKVNDVYNYKCNRHLLEKSYSHVPFSQLRELELRRVWDMPKDHLEMLLSNCRDLELLKIGNCITLTDNVISNVIRSNQFCRLSEIQIWNCNKFTVDSLLMFLRLNNPLFKLIVSACNNIRKKEYDIMNSYIDEKKLDVIILGVY